MTLIFSQLWCILECSAPQYPPSHCCWLTLSHSWSTNSSNSALFDGLWPYICLIIFQRCSMGLRSRVLICWSSSTPWLAWLYDTEHRPAGKLSQLSWGTWSDKMEATILPGQAYSLLGSCVLQRDEYDWFQPCWSTPRIISNPPPNSTWVEDTGTCRPL